MDKSLNALCDALKKIISYLKPQQHGISFLIFTGKINQGKTTLLRQSNLTYYPVDTEKQANFFYNQHGIILELGEAWLTHSRDLIGYTLKQLNRCHKTVKVTGMVLCIDCSELLLAEPVQIADHCKPHLQLLARFGQGLGYRVDTSIIFTKLDVVAGFCEFFQADHASELTKPLGFSLDATNQKPKLIANYKHQFDQMIEVLGQQIINKLHPARSSVKRTMIREFPLQLAHLRIPIQLLIQNLPAQFFQIQAVYFTSAEQGGHSVDRLNKKIQNEYALVVQDKFPQPNNYRAYFVEGALKELQDQTKRYTAQISPMQKWLACVAVVAVGLSFSWVVKQHVHASKLLDEASKELIAYETLLNQNQDSTTALYHLSQASAKLQQIPTSVFSVPIIEQLKIQIDKNTKHRLYDNFLPQAIAEIEKILSNPAETQIARYQALKIYLMLAEPNNYVESDVTGWFVKHWKTSNKSHSIDKQLLLLRNSLKQPMQPIAINRQLVSDARNYLNALPATYLYYSLAKHNFSTQKEIVTFEGFNLAYNELPIYYTKTGFKEVMVALPQIAMKLQQENWVLARQDLSNLQAHLEEAYCFEYVSWWQNFIRRTQPLHFQNFQQARQLTQTLHQTSATTKLIQLIQQQTSPELADDNSSFNQKIANQFTDLNLMSGSATNELSQTINELEKFITTLSLINDDGRTTFDLTKARFQGGSLSDPLSTLYNRAKQLPEPVATWAKQIADDTWYILISDSRKYLNKQWQQQVYREYQTAIANRYPLQPSQQAEVSLADFNRFFSPHGILNNFVTNFLKPFLDTSAPQWQSKEVNGYVMPISADITNELIRANVITNMFFPEDNETSKIDFSLQKINLDPVVANLQLTIGQTSLTDNQSSDSYTLFTWPQSNAKLTLSSIEGNHFELEETGTWAFFKMLQKVNVLVDNEDSASLQILFEVNGNSGRYLLKTQNQINPFSPGILTGFALKEEVA